MSQRLVHLTAIVAIVVLAAVLRFANLDDAPPGLHHDEATNGYDAYSSLKTGCDRWGQRWPIVLEAFGRSDHRTALYAYLIVPFHAVLGADHLTLATRMPAALVGVLAVMCVYVLVSKTHGRGTGLWAALMLALSPWHLQLSRFGHESTLTAGVTVCALMFMAFGRWPLRGGTERTGMLRAVPLGAAGAIFSLGLYTYPSMRLFTPAFLVAAAWIYRRELAGAWSDRKGRRAAGTMFLACFSVAAPMVFLCLTRWDQLMARAEQVSLFHNSTSFGESLLTSVTQYADHFSPRWLLTEGDRYTIQSPPGYGQLSFVAGFLLLIGAYVAIRDRHKNRSGMLVLAWLLLHPLSASITDSGPHALRSACGLPAFQWLAAIGCTATVLLLGTSTARRRWTGIACLLMVAANGAVVAGDYFGRWSRDPWVSALYQRDLRDAMRAIRPIAGDFERIYISDQIDRGRRWYSGEAYAIVLISLPVEPRDFQKWEKSIVDEPSGFHRVQSFGPFVMTTRSDVLREAFEDDPGQRAMFVARPGEIQGFRLIGTVASPDGTIQFTIFTTP